MDIIEHSDDSALILLTGGTGYVGGRLLTALEAGGRRVRCLARRARRFCKLERGREARSWPAAA
jgi:uncharacterized protein YbjT (DUF2867 family)